MARLVGPGGVDPHWITGSGHSWLVVPTNVTRALITPSACSYYGSDGLAYLEEDVDAPAFIKALGAWTPAQVEALPALRVRSFEAHVIQPRGLTPFAGKEQ